MTGTINNDTFNAGESGGNATLTAGDVIDGGAGTDTLKVAATGNIANTVLAGKTVSNVEQFEFLSGGTVTVDTTSISGATSLAVTGAGGAVSATAAGTTDISVSGQSAAGAVTVQGGKDIAVTNATGIVTVGAATAAEGKVTVTDTSVAGDAVAVDAKGDVTVNTAGSTGAAVTVGANTAATGAVDIDVASAAANNITMGAIQVTGGTTVNVDQTITAAATPTGASNDVTGAVTVTGTDNTTAVTVNNSTAVGATVAVPTVAGVKQVETITFSDVAANTAVTVGGLTFTTSKALTAAEVAAAFSNITTEDFQPNLTVAGDTQSGGVIGNGIYTGSFTAAFTSGAVTGNTVVFTANAAAANAANPLAPANATAATTVTGAASAGTTGVDAISNGAVSINDGGVASITEVTIDGFSGGATIGAAATAVKTINLSNAGSGATTVQAAASDVTMNLNKIDGGVTANALTGTLTLNATGAASTFGLSASAITGLTITGDQKLDIGTGSTLTAVTAVDASTNTGGVVVDVNGGTTSFTGSGAADTVELITTAAPTKAISLGAGDDTLIDSATLTGVGTGGSIDGGEGIDTLQLTMANAAALGANAQTFYTNFENLKLVTNAAATVNLANLGFTNSVAVASDANGLVLDNLASGGTVTLAANNTGTLDINVKDAGLVANTSDVTNLVLSSTNNLTGGTVDLTGVETINITQEDTEVVVAPATQTTNNNTLTVTSAQAKTITIGGDQNLNLTLTGSTAVTTIDGSANTGELIVTSLNTTSATTITGGAGDDQLTAATGTTADVLLGGAGSDQLVANAGLSTLTGGAGNDVFVINTASQNVNSYATVTDFTTGDLIDLGTVAAFNQSQVTLGGTAVFQDLANAAINAVDAANTASWFQFGGDTYIVKDVTAGVTNAEDFVNGEDFIVKIAGTVDLSQASFNSDQGTIGL